MVETRRGRSQEGRGDGARPPILEHVEPSLANPSNLGNPTPASGSQDPPLVVPPAAQRPLATTHPPPAPSTEAGSSSAASSSLESQLQDLRAAARINRGELSDLKNMMMNILISMDVQQQSNLQSTANEPASHQQPQITNPSLQHVLSPIHEGSVTPQQTQHSQTQTSNSYQDQGSAIMFRSVPATLGLHTRSPIPIQFPSTPRPIHSDPPPTYHQPSPSPVHPYNPPPTHFAPPNPPTSHFVQPQNPTFPYVNTSQYFPTSIQPTYSSTPTHQQFNPLNYYPYNTTNVHPQPYNPHQSMFQHSPYQFAAVSDLAL